VYPVVCSLTIAKCQRPPHTGEAASSSEST